MISNVGYVYVDLFLCKAKIEGPSYVLTIGQRPSWGFCAIGLSI
jgi:hypothetical protein